MLYRLLIVCMMFGSYSFSQKSGVKNTSRLQKVSVGCSVVFCQAGRLGCGYSVIFEDERTDFLTKINTQKAINSIYEQAFRYAHEERKKRIAHNRFVDNNKF